MKASLSLRRGEEKSPENCLKPKRVFRHPSSLLAANQICVSPGANPHTLGFASRHGLNPRANYLGGFCASRLYMLMIAGSPISIQFHIFGNFLAGETFVRKRFRPRRRLPNLFGTPGLARVPPLFSLRKLINVLGDIRSRHYEEQSLVRSPAVTFRIARILIDRQQLA
jgi:hypothetical protein